MMIENGKNREYPPVSVIVPVKNAAGTVEKLRNALLEQDYPPGRLQIIIVDNGSTDGTPDIIGKYPFILERENRIVSSYAARNRGLASAQGDIIAFTDSDCVPRPDWVRRGVATLMEKNADMAGGKVSFILSEPPSAAEIIDSVTFMQNEQNIKNKGTSVTANLFARKSLFDKAGLFAEAQSGEDFNWTGNATRKGFTLVYAPDAVVYHPARKLKALLEKSRRTATGSYKTARKNKSTFKRIWAVADKLVPVPSRNVTRFLIANPKVLLKKGLVIWSVSYLIKLNQLKGIVPLIFKTGEK